MMNEAGQMTVEAAKVFARHQTIQTLGYYAFVGAALYLMVGPTIRITTHKRRNKKEAK